MWIDLQFVNPIDTPQLISVRAEYFRGPRMQKIGCGICVCLEVVNTMLDGAQSTELLTQCLFF
jgi:hypothetical protein